MFDEMLVEMPSDVSAEVQVKKVRTASDSFQDIGPYVVTYYANETSANKVYVQCYFIPTEEKEKTTTPGISQLIKNELILSNFFKELSALQADGKIDAAVRLLFDRVEKWITDQKIKLANDLFIDPRMREYNADIQVGLLVITLPWASKLHSRGSFIEVSRTTLLKSYTENDTNKILKGLIA